MKSVVIWLTLAIAVASASLGCESITNACFKASLNEDAIKNSDAADPAALKEMKERQSVNQAE
jgi:hypothetical protein